MIGNWPLEQHCNQTSEFLERHSTYIDPIQPNLTGLGIIKTAQQLDQGTLTSAIGTNNCHNLASRNGEVEVLQGYSLAPGIAKGDLLKANPLFYG